MTAIYLAPRLPGGSSRLLGTVGQTECPSTALLRDRVYIVKPMLPWAGCALTAPFHPYLVDSPMETLPFPQAEMVTLHGESPPSHRTRLRWASMGALLWGRRYLSVALVLRFPSAGVTRYPCPVEPGLSSSGPFRFPSAAVQPSLRKYSTPKISNCQIPLKNLFGKGILEYTHRQDEKLEMHSLRC